MPEQSLLDRIVDRFEALLTEHLPAPYEVFRSREEALEREVSPSIVVLVGQVATKSFGDEADQHEAEILVGHVVRGDPWDRLADAADVLTHRAIASDEQLELLTSHLRRLSAAPDGAEADRTAGVLMVSYRVVFLTRRSDPTRTP
jgi:hypothetical protein